MTFTDDSLYTKKEPKFPEVGERLAEGTGLMALSDECYREEPSPPIRHSSNVRTSPREEALLSALPDYVHIGKLPTKHILSQGFNINSAGVLGSISPQDRRGGLTH